MKKTLISIATVASIALPLNAIEVYNNDGAKVDIYGSVKGLTGYGIYQGYDNKRFNEGNTIFLLQGNSRLGVKANVDGLFGTMELGVRDVANGDTIVSGFRQLYAGYNFGESYGTLLVGKTNSIAGTDFSSDIFFYDSGLVGFGNGTQGERRFQVQYQSPYGISFAVMESNIDKSAISNTIAEHKNVKLPVFAISYDVVGLDDNLIAKLAASYTLVNTRATIGNNRTDRNTINYPVPVHAYAINAAATYKMLNKSLYLSGIASYSVDAHLYSDAVTPKFDGLNGVVDEYQKKTEIRQNKQNMIKLYSAALEIGYNVLDNFKAILGGGYQYSIKQSLIYDVDFSFFDNKIFHSYGAFVQAQYNANKFLTLIPSVGYYGILRAAQKNGPPVVTINERDKRYDSQILMAIQTILNF